MINNERSIRRDPRVVYRELGGDAGGVLLNLDTGAYYAINTTGALIWGLTNDIITARDLTRMVRDRLDDAPASLEEDVADFITQLAARGLITFDETVRP